MAKVLTKDISSVGTSDAVANTLLIEYCEPSNISIRSRVTAVSARTLLKSNVDISSVGSTVSLKALFSEYKEPSNMSIKSRVVTSSSRYLVNNNEISSSVNAGSVLEKDDISSASTSIDVESTLNEALTSSAAITNPGKILVKSIALLSVITSVSANVLLNV